jgi:hypothetical protein
MTNDSQPYPSRLIPFSIAGGLLVTALYVYLYQWQPLPAPWGDLALNTISFLSAALGAVLTILIWRHFGPDEPQRALWGHFAVGLSFWALAEGIWLLYIAIQGEAPTVSIIDAFWVLAYGFFAAAFVLQFRLVFFSTPEQEQLWLAVAIGWAVLGTTGVTYFLHQTNTDPNQSLLATVVQAFYPVADLSLAVAALKLGTTFGRGAWGRVWLGLLAFVVSDSLYAWLSFSGLYAYSIESGNPLSLVADTLYVDAYLILALSALNQLLLLRYGPAPRRQG